MNRLASRAFVAALAAPFFATAAHAQPGQQASAQGLEPPRLENPAAKATNVLTGPNAPKDGFLGRRPLLKDLSLSDQKVLAKLILDYATANKSAVIKTHEATMTTPDLVGVHRAPYTKLFSWHRTYIQGLEDYLTSKGFSKFVPLPKWIPSDPIPAPFYVDKKGKRIVDVIDPKQDWTQFIHSKLSAFKQEIRNGDKDTTPNNLILSDTLVVPHNNTHNTIGGNMASMSSPSVPIFWCYHAFIDDIAWDYEHLPKKPMATNPAAAAKGMPEVGVTTVTGSVMVRGDDVMLHTPLGAFTVKDGAMKAILKGFDKKTVTVQATLKGTEADVESVTGMVMGADVTVKDKSGAAIGTRVDMEEVRITGQSATRFEIDHNGKRGFIPKKSVMIAEPSQTPGVNGAMDHHHQP